MAQENELLNVFYKDTNNSMVNRHIRLDLKYCQIIDNIQGIWTVQSTVTYFSFYKNKPYEKVKLHMPKNLEQNKDALKASKNIVKYKL